MPLIHCISRALFFKHSLPFPRSFSSMSSSVNSSADHGKARLRGVVFDMDGTLTVPTIDFPAMYKAVLGEDEYLAVKRKNPSGIDILHHVENWSPDKQRRAYEIIADFEKQGLDRLQIMPGASELCEFLDSRNIRRGLITRNVKASVDLFHERFGMTFSPALSREFRPCKPDPAPLLHICSAWEVQPHEVMMVGDSLKDDTVSKDFGLIIQGLCDWIYQWLVGSELELLHACLMKQGGMTLQNMQMWNLNQITRCLLLPKFIPYCGLNFIWRLEFKLWRL